MLALDHAIRSDTAQRANNEDAAFASPRLAAIADGVGGAAAGEVASRTVIHALIQLDKCRLQGRLDEALVEATTDNRNRTGSEVRHAFGKHNGNLGEPGSVAYLFDKQGVVVVDAERYTEDDLMVAIDAGAEDIAMDDDVFEVLTAPADLSAVRTALDDAGIAIENFEVAQRPKTLVPLDEEGATKLMKLIDALEDLDDVDAVHANFDVPADVLERVAG